MNQQPRPIDLAYLQGFQDGHKVNVQKNFIYGLLTGVAIALVSIAAVLTIQHFY